MAGKKHTHAGKVLDPKNPLDKPLIDSEAAIHRACERALAQIQARVLEHYHRHPDNAWNGAALVDLERTLKACYKDLGLDVGKAFRANLPAEMQAFYDKAKEEMRTAGRRNAIIGKPNTRLVKHFLDSSYEQVAMRTTRMSFEHIRQLRNLSADTLRTASLTGASVRDITKQMLARAQEIPGFEFIDAGGHKWKDETYFRMLARTEIMNAGRAAYDAECAEDGFDIVELDNSGEACEACEKWEGQVFSLTGATKGIPTKQDLIDAGVFHPNCTHSYSVVDDLELEERGLKVRQPRPDDGTNEEP